MFIYGFYEKKIKLILECLEHLQKIDETLFFQTSISSISSNYNLHKIRIKIPSEQFVKNSFDIKSLTLLKHYVILIFRRLMAFVIG